ncbi:MAG: acyltransferase [Candidatus Thiothrix moscowensis]|nr:acyltransferase [Candidatus Thiothrix moscowensis]
MKIDQLTFTRYIAALSVVFFHYGANVFPANLPLLNPVLTAGPIAVSYFYVLSGFIMAIAYYRPDNNQPFASGRYWLARFARIYPIYLLALLVMIAAKFNEAGSDPLTVGLGISMLQAWIPGYPLTLNSPGWSLSVEAFFYLFFPLLLLVAKRHHLKALIIASVVLWLSTQVAHTVLLNTRDYAPFSALHDFIYYNPVMHLNTFVIGFIAGVWLLEGKLQSFSSPLPNHAGLLACIALIVLLLIARQPLIAATGIRFDYTNGLIAPLFLVFIVLLALNTSHLSQYLQHKWMILLGEASFSLYILQKPLHGIYEKVVAGWIPDNSALHFYLFVIVLTGTAILSFQWVETPLRRFINSLYRTPEKSG